MITLPFQDFAGMNASSNCCWSSAWAGSRRTGTAPRRFAIAARRGYPIASPVGTHGSQILCVVLPDPGDAFRRLKAAGVVASLREGAIRLSPHVFNTIEEMVKVTEILDRP
jgi:selenocysteine lyase/cysteine desulfurase